MQTAAETAETTNAAETAETTNAAGTPEAPKEKAPGVGDLAKDLIRQGLGNEEVLAAVKEAFPEAKTSMASINWYRNKLRSDGENVPTARELKAGAKDEQKAAKEEAKAKAKAEKEEAKAKAKAEKEEAKAKAKAEKEEAKAKVKAEKDAEAKAAADAKAEADNGDGETEQAGENFLE